MAKYYHEGDGIIREIKNISEQHSQKVVNNNKLLFNMHKREIIGWSCVAIAISTAIYTIITAAKCAVENFVHFHCVNGFVGFLFVLCLFLIYWGIFKRNEHIKQ